MNNFYENNTLMDIAIEEEDTKDPSLAYDMDNSNPVTLREPGPMVDLLVSFGVIPPLVISPPAMVVKNEFEKLIAENILNNKQLLDNIFGLNFDEPSSFQKELLPLILENPPKNIIGQGQSGVGKTITYIIAALARVDPELDYLQVVILVPSRALSIQIFTIVQQLSIKTAIRSSMSFDSKPTYDSTTRSHIIIGTYGSIIQTIKTKNLDTQHLKMYIVDEMPTTLNAGATLLRVFFKKMTGVQCLAFGTILSLHVQRNASLLVPDQTSTNASRRILLKNNQLCRDKVYQVFVKCFKKSNLPAIITVNNIQSKDPQKTEWIEEKKVEANKINYLSKVYNTLTVSQVLVFCQTKADANKITALMKQRYRQETDKIITISSDLGIIVQDRIMDDFNSAESECKMLVTTDLFARGIDYPNVSIVVNYDIPLYGRTYQVDPVTYLDRIGRLGGFERCGYALTLAGDEVSVSHLRYIEKFFGCLITETEF